MSFNFNTLLFLILALSIVRYITLDKEAYVKPLPVKKPTWEDYFPITNRIIQFFHEFIKKKEVPIVEESAWIRSLGIAKKILIFLNPFSSYEEKTIEKEPEQMSITLLFVLLGAGIGAAVSIYVVFFKEELNLHYKLPLHEYNLLVRNMAELRLRKEYSRYLRQQYIKSMLTSLQTVIPGEGRPQYQGSPYPRLQCIDNNPRPSTLRLTPVISVEERPQYENSPYSQHQFVNNSRPTTSQVNNQARSQTQYLNSSLRQNSTNPSYQGAQSSYSIHPQRQQTDNQRQELNNQREQANNQGQQTDNRGQQTENMNLPNNILSSEESNQQAQSNTSNHIDLRDKSNYMCVICNVKYDECKSDTRRTKCGHYLHIECMNNYLPVQKKCPVCQKSIPRWINITKKCVLCLDLFTADEDMVKITCGHKMHQDCYDQFVKVKHRCPICKKLIRGSKPTEECPICLERLTDNRQLKKTKCGHTFHLSCIGQWAPSGGRQTCPLCRDVI